MNNVDNVVHNDLLLKRSLPITVHQLCLLEQQWISLNPVHLEAVRQGFHSNFNQFCHILIPNHQFGLSPLLKLPVPLAVQELLGSLLLFYLDQMSRLIVQFLAEQSLKDIALLLWHQIPILFLCIASIVARHRLETGLTA